MSKGARFHPFTVNSSAGPASSPTGSLIDLWRFVHKAFDSSTLADSRVHKTRLLFVKQPAVETTQSQKCFWLLPAVDPVLFCPCVEPYKRCCFAVCVLLQICFYCRRLIPLWPKFNEMLLNKQKRKTFVIKLAELQNEWTFTVVNQLKWLL